ncbi:MAG TPA: TetR/AcrR family transcriptional regulator [Acidimicrobiales bacterium]
MAQTARTRARAAVIEEIKAAARAQLAAEGAAALSVRHVARQLGMSSSGVYRYFASRDELLTALIIDAYNAMGAAVEEADSKIGRDDLGGRWWAVSSTVRSWAMAHPHEYGLVFGSPVPGYDAPQDTVLPATRVPITLASILRDAWDADRVEAVPGTQASGVLDPSLKHGATPLQGLPEDVVVRGILAWVELFGLVSFELFGHLVGSVADPDAFFRSASERIATSIGITRREPGG